MFESETTWQVDAAAEKLSNSLFMTPGPNFEKSDNSQVKKSSARKKSKKNKRKQNPKNDSSNHPTPTAVRPVAYSTPRLAAGNKRNKYKNFSQSKDGQVIPKGSNAVQCDEKISNDRDKDELKQSNVLTKKKGKHEAIKKNEKVTNKENGVDKSEAKLANGSLRNKTTTPDTKSESSKKKKLKKTKSNERDDEKIKTNEKTESESTDSQIAKKKKKKPKRKVQQQTNDNSEPASPTPVDKTVKSKKKKTEGIEMTPTHEIKKVEVNSGNFVRSKKKRKNKSKNKYAMLAGVNKADKKDFLIKFNVKEYVEKLETKKKEVENAEKTNSGSHKTKSHKRKRKVKQTDDIQKVENDGSSKEDLNTELTEDLNQTTETNMSKKLKAKHTLFKKDKLQAIFNERQPEPDTDKPVESKKMKNSSNKSKTPQTSEKKTPKHSAFHQKMVDQLNAARFRYLNEQLYTCSGQDAYKLFSEDEAAFDVYHKGFQSQVSKWPSNPVDIIIEYIKQQPKKRVVADFGCGDAKIADSVPNKVHSFDLVAVNEHITACDIANVPLTDGSVDIAVFCLALMGTNLVDYLKEAHRVLRKKGTLKIAEVVSRFENLNRFIIQVEKLGFMLERKDESNKMFVMLDFKKGGNMDPSAEPIQLLPCVYKKR
ncbi:unnamed protein product [Owenia fusiformis]|uniref:Ribosomal RNA-processing protein 8 n=1 Tax=Owenia fusiformis TaxID=6347 RepID=A0A8J1TH97_OWEFU|nr:unnamed protein product [Owenia fusiformis]